MGWNVTGYDFCLLCRLTKQEGLLLNAAGCAFSWEPTRFVDEAGRIFFEASFMESPDCCKLIVLILPSNFAPLKISCAPPFVAVGTRLSGLSMSCAKGVVDVVAELLLLFARFGW